MLTTVSDAVFAATAVLGVGISLVGRWLYRRRDEPGADALAWFCLVFATGAVVGGAYGVAAVNPRGPPAGGSEPTGVGVWYAAVSSLLYLAPIPWCAFVLRYTGRGRELWRSRRARVGVAATLSTTSLLVWFDLGRSTVGAGAVPLSLGVAVLALALVLFSLGVFLSTVAVLVYAARTSGRLRTRGGVSLAAAGTAPVALAWSAADLVSAADPAVRTLGSGTVGVGVAVAGAGLILGVGRYDALETTPAAGAVGRRALLRETEDPVLVLDHDGRVSEANPAAARQLSDDDVVGGSVGDLLGTGVAGLQSADTVELGTGGYRRQYDPQVSTITDRHDRPLGTVVTLRDVTERRIREQRLEVLNRVLRHNLRNKLSIVKGTADNIAEREASPGAIDRLGDAADELLELGEKAREVERLMRQNGHDDVPVGLDHVVEDVVRSVASDYPAVRFETRVDGDPVLRGHEDLVRHLLSNVVENGAEHNTAAEPRVSVSVTATAGRDDAVTIAVADNGPGIPEHERHVITDGTETPLEHASGIDLWSASWCVRRLAGSMSFETSRFDGARVVVDLPETSPVHSLEVDPGRSAAAASGD